MISKCNDVTFSPQACTTLLWRGEKMNGIRSKLGGSMNRERRIAGIIERGLQRSKKKKKKKSLYLSAPIIIEMSTTPVGYHKPLFFLYFSLTRTSTLSDFIGIMEALI